jgi:hypothetical protein
VKEIYDLLGGKELLETPPPVVTEQEIPSTTPVKQAITEEIPLEEIPPEEKPKEEVDEGYPTIEELLPEESKDAVAEEKEAKRLPEEMPEAEDQGEKISFL